MHYIAAMCARGQHCIFIFGVAIIIIIIAQYIYIYVIDNFGPKNIIIARYQHEFRRIADWQDGIPRSNQTRGFFWVPSLMVGNDKDYI